MENRTEPDESLKTMLANLDEWIRTLASSDSDQEVNAHYDQLDSEVVLAIESATERLDLVKAALLEQIRAHRVEALAAALTTDDGTRQELARVAAEVDQFGKRCAGLEERAIEPAYLGHFLALAKQQVRVFGRRVKDIRARMKERAFGGRLVAFKRSDSFLERLDQVGRLDVFSLEAAKKTGQVHECPLETLKADSFVEQCLFLSNGCLAVASERVVKVYQLPSRVVGVFPASFLVKALAEVANGSLVSAGQGGQLLVWGLESRALVQTVQAHRGLVRSLCPLPDVRLTSLCNLDGTIKIWQADARRELGLLAVVNERLGSIMSPLQVLADGLLVSFSSRLTGGTVLKLWSPEDGRLVKKLATSLRSVSVFCVLPSGLLAIANERGSIEIRCVDEDAPRLTIEQAGPVSWLRGLPNGELIAAVRSGNASIFRVYNSWTGELLQSLPAHTGDVSTAALSADGKYLASAGSDHAVKFWSLSA